MGPAPFDAQDLPWLENGERMNAQEFIRRYEQTPPGLQAQLIEGVVYIMASPLRNRHGRSGSHLSGCLFLYSAATPGTEVQDNTTTILGAESVPQPDSALLIRSECGGQSHDGSGDDDYTYGAPELVADVAYSSRSIDLHGKFRDYERAGVREYVICDLRDRLLRWFTLRDGHFTELPVGPDGIYRSLVFPGLWIDPTALLSGNKAGLIAILEQGLASPEHTACVAEIQTRRGEHPAQS